MRQASGLNSLTVALVVVVVAVVASIILAVGQVRGIADPAIKYYPRGQDPGEGNRIVGCCKRYGPDGKYRGSEFGWCHLLLRKSEGCNDCCEDMGMKSKAVYANYETQCRCV